MTGTVLKLEHLEKRIMTFHTANLPLSQPLIALPSSSLGLLWAESWAEIPGGMGTSLWGQQVPGELLPV